MNLYFLHIYFEVHPVISNTVQSSGANKLKLDMHMKTITKVLHRIICQDTMSKKNITQVVVQIKNLYFMSRILCVHLRNL